MKRRKTIFVLLLIVGFFASTAVHRFLQNARPVGDIPKISLNEAEKKLIESRDNMSKWLLGLAYSALAGVLSIGLKDRDSIGLDTKLPMSACGLLVLSMYGAFLFQDSVVFSLSKGPLYHLYGPLMDFPIEIQFWTLIAALVLISLWLFRSPTKITVVLSGVLFIGLAGEVKGQATPETNCISNWETAREINYSEAGRTSARSVILKLAKRAELRSPQSCDFVFSLLDQIRWHSYRLNEDRSVKAMESDLRTIDQELSSPGLSAAQAVTELVKIAELWRAPSGLLIVESQTKGITVLLDGDETGLTDWERRLAPGKHSIEVVRGGRAIYSNKSVQIEDGKLCRLNIDTRP